MQATMPPGLNKVALLLSQQSGPAAVTAAAAATAVTADRLSGPDAASMLPVAAAEHNSNLH
jgi:hypothetical protein